MPLIRFIALGFTTVRNCPIHSVQLAHSNSEAWRKIDKMYCWKSWLQYIRQNSKTTSNENVSYMHCHKTSKTVPEISIYRELKGFIKMTWKALELGLNTQEIVKYTKIQLSFNVLKTTVASMKMTSCRDRPNFIFDSK